MPVCVAPNNAKSGRQGRHRLPRWLSCQRRFATACPWLHSFSPRILEWSQSNMLVDERERGQRSSSLSRQAPCRGRPGKLLLPGPCLLEWPLRQAPLAGAFVLRAAISENSSCRGLPGEPLSPGPGALSGLPDKLLLSGPCLLGLNTLFLNGSKGTTMIFGGHLASPAMGCYNCACTSSGY